MTTLTLLLFFTVLYSLHVCADLYVIDPPTHGACHGNQPCTVSWLDDGIAPLLDVINICNVALYNGDAKLIQQIAPVDVSTARSLTFTPAPGAGPNSDKYYVNFTSVDPVRGGPYHQYSSFFTIDNMSGSFNSPVPSLTSTIPIPSSLLAPPSTSAPTPSGISTSRISSTVTPLSQSSPSPSPTSVTSDQNLAFNILSRCSKLTVTATSVLLFTLLELQ